MHGNHSTCSIMVFHGFQAMIISFFCLSDVHRPNLVWNLQSDLQQSTKQCLKIHQNIMKCQRWNTLKGLYVKFISQKCQIIALKCSCILKKWSELNISTKKGSYESGLAYPEIFFLSLDNRRKSWQCSTLKTNNHSYEDTAPYKLLSRNEHLCLLKFVFHRK